MAADRLVGAVRMVVELGEGKTQRTQVGWHCQFCMALWVLHAGAGLFGADEGGRRQGFRLPWP